MQLFALTLFDSSFNIGVSMEGFFRWQAAVQWMESVLPLLRNGAMLIVFYWVAVLLPMSIFRRMHPLIAKSLRSSSLFVGLVCWWQAFIVVYRLLGWFAAAIGLLLAGVGVIPMALLAAASRQDWFALGNLIATAALTILPRLIAKGICNRDARNKAGARDLRFYAHE